MSDKKSSFIRVYQRQSKSPWSDHSTVLLLAGHQVTEGGAMELSFNRYIYQHKFLALAKRSMPSISRIIP